MRIPSTLNKIPQYTRANRHVSSVLRHGTPLKIYNLFRVEMERKKRKVVVTGKPYLLIADTCNICNLKCPLCPTGINTLNRPKRIMPFDDFKIIFDKFSKYLFEVSLHNWGEPFLNKELFKIIKYAQSKNVGSNLSSNLNAITADNFDEIIDSQLEYLIVSLDAVTPEVYDQYRVSGSYHKVIGNLQGLIKRRTEKKSTTPVIEWQFIIMRHNQHQIDAAESLAKDIGVDIFRTIPVGFAFDAPNRLDLTKQWFPSGMGEDNTYRGIKFGHKNMPGPCFYLYRSIVANADGGISPCCIVYDKRYDFGNLLTAKVEEVWNNDYYQSARSQFSLTASSSVKIPTPCDKCDLFKKAR